MLTFALYGGLLLVVLAVTFLLFVLLSKIQLV